MRGTCMMMIVVACFQLVGVRFRVSGAYDSD
jgi:hypothetical protein